MDSENVVNDVASIVLERFDGEGSGHDWWHIQRVWNMSKRISSAEGADMLVVELAALLHDIADWKFHDGDDEAGPCVAEEILTSFEVNRDIIEKVCEIIRTVSFKGAGVPDQTNTIEAQVVQDADRLDAMGAIGIARVFAYGGHAQRPIHDPRIPAIVHETSDSYKKSKGTSFNHFYEKILLLEDRLHTETARNIARERHRFLKRFMKRFLKEWEGQK